MITITKQNDGVLFEFEDSKKYLYGNGSILVPFNTLSIVADESDMITLKKAASNDVFLSARYDTDLGYRSKDDAIDDLKDLLFAETGGGGGGGVTSGQVQSMIDSSISGKADTSAVTAVASDVSTVSGQVATKVETSDFNTYSAATATALSGKADTSAVTAVNDALTAHTADTGIHVTQADKTSWNAKAEPYSAGTGIDITDNVISCTVSGGSANVIELTQAQYDALSGSVDPSAIYVITDATAFDPSTKVDTSAITTSITSGSTDDEIPTAKATFDAIQAGGGGGGATYSAGTNISIDTGNTISCTLPIYSGSGNNSLVSHIGNSAAYGVAEGDGAVAWGSSTRARGDCSIAIGATNDVKGARSITVGFQNTLEKAHSAAFGNQLHLYNIYEFSSGRYNNSVSASTTFSNSGNTLFSVGNGDSTSDKHNALEIRQNGDLFFADTDNTTYQNYYQKPMVRLQDMYAALGGLKFVQCTQAEYDTLVSGGTVDSSTIYFITNVVS